MNNNITLKPSRFNNTVYGMLDGYTIYGLKALVQKSEGPEIYKDIVAFVSNTDKEELATFIVDEENLSCRTESSALDEYPVGVIINSAIESIDRINETQRKMNQDLKNNPVSLSDKLKNLLDLKIEEKTLAKLVKSIAEDELA